eukprot:m.217531 g.217531  ORF g.217531 m.217531 type:complete len:85 (-) comp19129_c0_seq3:46-300(-)
MFTPCRLLPKAPLDNISQRKRRFRQNTVFAPEQVSSDANNRYDCVGGGAVVGAVGGGTTVVQLSVVAGVLLSVVSACRLLDLAS